MVFEQDGLTCIDMRGQTCPGYLLAINRETDKLPPTTEVALLITYPPCGDDIRAWCKGKDRQYQGVEHCGELYRSRIST